MQEGRWRAVFHRQQAEHGRTAEDDKRQNGNDLDQREPEFALSKEAGRDHVKQENRRTEDQTPQPHR
ncbi:hypothetical protein D3C80_1855950 [compost metagenome]